MTESDDESTTQAVIGEFQEAAREGREVEIDIRHNIIQQFSEQLYDNPRRAIEELVCNSYDAYATSCYVSTPKQNGDVLQVLDNGVSMSEEGLDKLWDIAGGPKHEAVLEGKPRKLKGRKQIGRFGVGKLAAFALGDELTHVATTEGKTRIISVSMEQILTEEDKRTPSSTIYQMDEEEARDYLGDYLDGIPDPWAMDWDSWTLAVVDQIPPDKTGRELRAENLDRMIRTAIPLSANFEVHRNGKEVEQRSYGEIREEMNIVGDEEFQSKLETELSSFWADYDDTYDDPEDVPDSLTGITETKLEPYEENDQDDREEKEDEEEDEEEVEDELDGVIIPKLGGVSASGAIYQETLTPDKLEQQDIYDHGFKLRVRGKLLNRTDPLFGISQRSHSYWNAFRGEFEMPDLDDDILVQRNELKDGVKKQLAQLVMKSFFNTLRTRAEESEDKGDPGSFGHRLHTISPYKAAEALEGLTGEEGEYPEGGWDDVEVKLAELGRSGNAVKYDPSDQTIYVNDEHPLFEALETRKDLSAELRKVIGEALAGTEIAKGYLSYYDVRKDLIDDTKEITENSLEIAARYIQDPYKYYNDHLDDMSHEGDDPFEQAITDALNFIGLESEKKGEKGESDGIVTLPQEDDSPMYISIEAKGKEEGAVSHSQLNISTAREHMEEDNCDHAVAVARDFTLDPPPGEEEQEVSKFVKQLRMYDDVSALTVGDIQKVLELHKQRPFSHPQLKKIFTNQEDPDDVSEFIDTVWKELPAETELVREVLETAYEIQRDDDRKQRIGLIMAEVQAEDDEIETILKAAQISTGGMVTVRENGRYFSIHQQPEQIMEAMSGLGRSGG